MDTTMPGLTATQEPVTLYLARNDYRELTFRNRDDETGEYMPFAEGLDFVWEFYTGETKQEVLGSWNEDRTTCVLILHTDLMNTLLSGPTMPDTHHISIISGEDRMIQHYGPVKKMRNS